MTEENKVVEKASELGIQQLNLSYDKVQDRLLFRVGLSDDTEIALWFTYRFSRGLWAALNGEAHLPESKAFSQAEAAEAVEQFEQEVKATEALSKLDFVTEYTPRNSLQDDGTLLAISFKLGEDAKLLEITCLEELAVNVNLTPELVLAISNMLQLATKEAGWSMDEAVSVAMMDASEVPKVLH